ncbi:uncharacterized protein CPUR_07347 [Claviceps purpurea 20.1]|uniref:Uncharacterized protein n=1 Tax=Claviceps purpurea (strain 20.1) TaxID=1111077 RepID=M1WF83_CLAP2|nr:uncharacterized protein CPUR_07347 [Claviceps purpurea 20.1]
MGRCTDLRNNGDLDNERHEQERLAEPRHRQKIPADTRSKAPPVGKDSAADKVSADPVQRRSKDLKRGCPTEAALDKDSVVGRALYMQRLVPPQNLAGGWRRGGFGDCSDVFFFLVSAMTVIFSDLCHPDVLDVFVKD